MTSFSAVPSSRRTDPLQPTVVLAPVSQEPQAAIPATDVCDAPVAGGAAAGGDLVCGAGAPALQRPAPRELPRLASWPELRPLPPLGDDATATVAVPMHTETGWVWTALGADEDAANRALDALVPSGVAGREQALSHIATAAVCPSVRVDATHRLGNVPSVAAVDALRALTAAPQVGVAQAAASQLSSDTANMLCHEAHDPPTDINRCLRDLICHLQDSDVQASSSLFVLMLRADAHPADVAEHLTVVAATCRARVACEAWERLEVLCRKDASLHDLWLRNLFVLQRAAHPDVARAAQCHTA